MKSNCREAFAEDSVPRTNPKKAMRFLIILAVVTIVAIRTALPISSSSINIRRLEPLPLDVSMAKPSYSQTSAPPLPPSCAVNLPDAFKALAVINLKIHPPDIDNVNKTFLIDQLEEIFLESYNLIANATYTPCDEEYRQVTGVRQIDMRAESNNATATSSFEFRRQLLEEQRDLFDARMTTIVSENLNLQSSAHYIRVGGRKMQEEFSWIIFSLLFDVTVACRGEFCLGNNAELFGPIIILKHEFSQAYAKNVELLVTLEPLTDAVKEGGNSDLKYSGSSLSLDPSNTVVVDTVREIEEQSCPEDGQDFDFAKTVTIELSQDPSLSINSLEDPRLNIIEESYVSTYNKLIRNEFCDPLFRRLYKAEVVAIGKGNTSNNVLTLEMHIKGKCRGCDPNDIDVYATPSVLVGPIDSHTVRDRYLIANTNDNSYDVKMNDNWSLKSLPSGSKDWKSKEENIIDDKKCYCDAQPFGNRAPFEAEFISQFLRSINTLNILGISVVDTCHFGTVFSTGLMVPFTEKELQSMQEAGQDSPLLLEAAMKDTLNDLLTGTEDTCNTDFRLVEVVKLVHGVNITRNFANDDNGIDDNGIDELLLPSSTISDETVLAPTAHGSNRRLAGNHSTEGIGRRVLIGLSIGVSLGLAVGGAVGLAFKGKVLAGRGVGLSFGLLAGLAIGLLIRLVVKKSFLVYLGVGLLIGILCGLSIILLIGLKLWMRDTLGQIYSTPDITKIMSEIIDDTESYSGSLGSMNVQEECSYLHQSYNDSDSLLSLKSIQGICSSSDLNGSISDTSSSSDSQRSVFKCFGRDDINPIDCAGSSSSSTKNAIPATTLASEKVSAHFNDINSIDWTDSTSSSTKNPIPTTNLASEKVSAHFNLMRERKYKWLRISLTAGFVGLIIGLAIGIILGLAAEGRDDIGLDADSSSDTTESIEGFADVSESPTFSPFDPLAIGSKVHEVPVLFIISGICNGCDDSLFADLGDDVIRKLRAGTSKSNHFLQSKPSRDLLEDNASTSACFCPLGSTQTNDKLERSTVFEIFESKIEEEIETNIDPKDIIEVNIVECDNEVEEFNTRAKLTLAGDITASIIPLLENTFKDTYNYLIALYCDPYFRNVTDVEAKVVTRRRYSESQDMQDCSFESVIEFDVKGTCFGCDERHSLFDSSQFQDGQRRNLKSLFESYKLSSLYDSKVRQNSRRRLQNLDVCFCEGNTISERAPSGEEFVAVYNDEVLGLPNSCGVTDIKVDENEISTDVDKRPINDYYENLFLKSPAETPSVPLAFILDNIFQSADPSTIQAGNDSIDSPTEQNLDILTFEPTSIPTITPTADPTKRNTIQPTVSPRSPTGSPTTTNPTTAPSINPTKTPTFSPTSDPTAGTTNPTFTPRAKQEVDPTFSPTKIQTSVVTTNPTTVPTSNPTSSTTASPTNIPTDIPTDTPTDIPTDIPTDTPTDTPTDIPKEIATSNPTASPTSGPTASPTTSPTVSPTSGPTTSPTVRLTASPTVKPTFLPTNTPSIGPTDDPTADPTAAPTMDPTAVPTTSPTTSAIPTTSSPTGPTEFPTFSPTSTDSPTECFQVETNSPTDENGKSKEVIPGCGSLEEREKRKEAKQQNKQN